MDLVCTYCVKVITDLKFFISNQKAIEEIRGFTNAMLTLKNENEPSEDCVVIESGSSDVLKISNKDTTDDKICAKIKRNDRIESHKLKRCKIILEKVATSKVQKPKCSVLENKNETSTHLKTNIANESSWSKLTQLKRVNDITKSKDCSLSNMNTESPKKFISQNPILSANITANVKQYDTFDLETNTQTITSKSVPATTTTGIACTWVPINQADQIQNSKNSNTTNQSSLINKSINDLQPNISSSIRKSLIYNRQPKQDVDVVNPEVCNVNTTKNLFVKFAWHESKFRVALLKSGCPVKYTELSHKELQIIKKRIEVNIKNNNIIKQLFSTHSPYNETLMLFEAIGLSEYIKSVPK